MPEPQPPPPSVQRLQVQISRSVHIAVVLALLYFARDVLVPITLALILGLLLAPMVRALKHRGLGAASAVLLTVGTLAACAAGVALVAGWQVASIATSLPHYEATIRTKLQAIQEATVGQTVEGETGRMFRRLADEAVGAGAERAGPAGTAEAAGVVPVEIRQRPPTALQLMSGVVTTLWEPLGKAGIVLLVLVFVLLEYESLRDRFIRLLGGGNLQGTTRAFNDAGERLSRYFVSQFGVNLGVGAAIGLGSFAIGLPHALLWAVLTAVLRFVPYVGVPLVAVAAALLAAAVDPGWALLAMTLGVFVVVPVVAGQIIEPQLYSHSTGLSPLSVVLAAIFWSWLWGPLGLLMAVPLTLCLVVAGRHVEPLRFLDVLLGDMPALDMPQRFYQRALSGDANEIIDAARAYLRNGSFAKYGDAVLMPALRMSIDDLEGRRIDDLEGRRIDAGQQRLLRDTIAQVLDALGADGPQAPRRKRRPTVLDDDSVGIGRHLRQRREVAAGRWQGPLEVPPGSIVICIGLGSQRDELVTEVLVRILRDSGIDARHRAIGEAQAGAPPGASPESVALIMIVCTAPADDWPHALAVAAEARRRLPGAGLVAALPLTAPDAPEMPPADGSYDGFVNSMEEALRVAAGHVSAGNAGGAPIAGATQAP